MEDPCLDKIRDGAVHGRLASGVVADRVPVGGDCPKFAAHADRRVPRRSVSETMPEKDPLPALPWGFGSFGW